MNNSVINCIKSFGVILFYLDQHKIPHFLIYQRRDTFEYTDFLQGIWTHKKHLYTLLSLVTEDERNRLLNYTFDELWNDVWIDHNCKIYKEKYALAKEKFESVRECIPKILSEMDIIQKESPWGFPKGKKNIREKEMECAIREFTEEVNINLSRFNVITSEILTEVYKGSNRKNYSTHYYLVQCDSELYPEQKIIIPDGIRKECISDEASQIKWITKEEARYYLNERREELLDNATKIIKEVC